MFKVVSNGSIYNKSILLRVDYNVPFEKGIIKSASKIKATLATLKLLQEHAKCITIITHLGRPQSNKEYSLKDLISQFEEIIGAPINFLPSVASKPKPGLNMLENVRHFAGETNNCHKFAHSLSELGEVLVQDAFACCHRKHASMHALSEILPSYMGLSLAKELDNLSAINPRKSLVILGGNKPETKLAMIKALADKHFDVFVSGNLVNCCNPIVPAFYQFDGLDVNGNTTNKKPFYDIGPSSLDFLCAKLSRYDNILWNGPLGKVESLLYQSGTQRLLNYISKNCHHKTIIGGGDTVSAIQHSKSAFKFISQGGGAFLAYLIDKQQPGLQHLQMQ